MAEVILTRGYVALIDDEDLPLVSQYRWWASSSKKPYAFTQIARKNLFMHRLITNAPTGVEVDHINREPLDNRRNNLRLCSRIENCLNRDLAGGKSGYIGVEWRQDTERSLPYRPYIRENGRTVRGPHFATAFAAAFERDRMALKRWGNTAPLNFPELLLRDWGMQ